MVAVKIREMREAAGMTVASLASAVGVHRQAVYRWEDGERTPDVETLAQICDVLGASRADRADLLTPAGQHDRPGEAA